MKPGKGKEKDGCRGTYPYDWTNLDHVHNDEPVTYGQKKFGSLIGQALKSE
jgi:hypothetical protein